MIEISTDAEVEDQGATIDNLKKNKEIGLDAEGWGVIQVFFLNVIYIDAEAGSRGVSTP